MRGAYLTAYQLRLPCGVDPLRLQDDPAWWIPVISILAQGYYYSVSGLQLPMNVSLVASK